MPFGAHLTSPRLGDVIGDVGRQRGFAHARDAPNQRDRNASNEAG